MGSSGPEEAIKGIVEDVKGKAKEIIGIVTNRDGLREEGRAQQDKAQAEIVSDYDAHFTDGLAAGRSEDDVAAYVRVLNSGDDPKSAVLKDILGACLAFAA